MPNGIAPWPQNFRPTPGEFGVLWQTLTRVLGAAPPTLVGTATTNVYVGVPKDRRVYVAGAALQGTTAYNGDSTITATLVKRSGSTTTALTAAYDLKTAISTSANVDIPITASDADATLAPGDVLYWAVGAAGTISTVGDHVGVVEAAIIN